MSLFVLSISHKTAPVELREKLSFSPGETEQGLRAQIPEFLKELVILSTCNRTEIYGSLNPASGPQMEAARAWCEGLLNRHFHRPDLAPFLEFKQDRAMVEHLFRVAAGLESLVFGENEILKQVKDAYALAQRAERTGKIFNVLFQRALYVGKLVRTHTAINQGALSVGSVAVSLAEKIFGDLTESRVLIFGAGKMAEVSARYLLSKKVKRLWVANRTLENARDLARRFEAEALTLEQGLEHLAAADIVITSMAAPQPILAKADVSRALARRQNRPLFIIDIAVPRNVEPGAHQLDNVYLYNVDDLESIVHENLKSRSAEIEKAARIAREKTEEIAGWIESVRRGSEKSLKHRPDFLHNAAV